MIFLVGADILQRLWVLLGLERLWAPGMKDAKAESVDPSAVVSPRAVVSKPSLKGQRSIAECSVSTVF